VKTKVVMTALKAADPQSHRPQAMTGQDRSRVREPACVGAVTVVLMGETIEPSGPVTVPKGEQT
jgi:hypothetical protein